MKAWTCCVTISNRAWALTPTWKAASLARRRHLQALEQAAEHLQQGKAQLLGAWAGELLAEELRLAQQNLSEITGEFTSDDLLGADFLQLLYW